MPRFQLSSLFSDGAVLCRDREIRLFGTAEEGTCLTAKLLDAREKALACGTCLPEGGRFLLLLPPQAAQTGCTLRVSDGQEEVLCRDIAIGDVYLANGQSNMELELQNASEGRQLIPVHDNPLVRYYNVPKFPRECPEADDANRNARWVPVAPGTAADMSAAAYFFAMKLQPALGVPVGIIDCYWGGTSVTCWMDEEALARCDEGQRYMREYEENSRGKSLEQYLQEEEAFGQETRAWDQAAEKLKQQDPDITPQGLKDALGPYPWHPPIGCGSPFRPHGLFHTMLERVIPCALTGVLYYQGEEDTWRTERYDTLLTAYVLRLRELFMNDSLPFLNVQLPMWIDAGAQDSFTWPRTRLAQQRVCDNLRNTGLAILIDEGEYDNIHPVNKRVVGERLYEEAMDVVYHRPARKAVFALGKYTAENTLHIRLSAPVAAREKGEYLLEIAGQDGVYRPAQVRLADSELILSHPQIQHPISARYAWTDYAIVRLFGPDGLPLAPFWLR